MNSTSTSDPDRLVAKSHGRSSGSSRVKLPTGRPRRDIVLPSPDSFGGGSGGTGGLDAGGTGGAGMLAGGGQPGPFGPSAKFSGFDGFGGSGFGGGAGFEFGPGRVGGTDRFVGAPLGLHASSPGRAGAVGIPVGGISSAGCGSAPDGGGAGAAGRGAGSRRVPPGRSGAAGGGIATSSRSWIVSVGLGVLACMMP